MPDQFVEFRLCEEPTGRSHSCARRRMPEPNKQQFVPTYQQYTVDEMQTCACAVLVLRHLEMLVPRRGLWPKRIASTTPERPPEDRDNVREYAVLSHQI